MGAPGLRLARCGPFTRYLRGDGASSFDDRVSVILIFSADPLGAALLAAAVELADHTPRFPQAGESARAALRRVRPRIALVDCDHEDACTEAFIGPAVMTGARVLLFRSPRTRREAGELAGRLGVEVIEMPVDHEALARQIRALLER
jgi:DNA-binding NtrC family response regulator